MKKLLSLSLLALVLTMTSCAHHGCCKSGQQCDMKKEDCKNKNQGQCPMKDGEKSESKEEAKK